MPLIRFQRLRFAIYAYFSLRRHFFATLYADAYAAELRYAASLRALLRHAITLMILPHAAFFSPLFAVSFRRFR